MNINYCPFCGNNLFDFYTSDEFVNEVQGVTFLSFDVFSNCKARVLNKSKKIAYLIPNYEINEKIHPHFHCS